MAERTTLSAVKNKLVADLYWLVIEEKNRTNAGRCPFPPSVRICVLLSFSHCVITLVVYTAHNDCVVKCIKTVHVERLSTLEAPKCRPQSFIFVRNQLAQVTPHQLIFFVFNEYMNAAVVTCMRRFTMFFGSGHGGNLFDVLRNVLTRQLWCD